MEEPEWKEERQEPRLYFRCGVYQAAIAKQLRLNQRIEAILPMNMRFVGGGSLHDG